MDVAGMERYWLIREAGKGPGFATIARERADTPLEALVALAMDKDDVVDMLIRRTGSPSKDAQKLIDAGYEAVLVERKNGGMPQPVL